MSGGMRSNSLLRLDDLLRLNDPLELLSLDDVLGLEDAANKCTEVDNRSGKHQQANAQDRKDVSNGRVNSQSILVLKESVDQCKAEVGAGVQSDLDELGRGDDQMRDQEIGALSAESNDGQNSTDDSQDEPDAGQNVQESALSRDVRPALEQRNVNEVRQKEAANQQRQVDSDVDSKRDDGDLQDSLLLLLTSQTGQVELLSEDAVGLAMSSRSSSSLSMLGDGNGVVAFLVLRDFLHSLFTLSNEGHSSFKDGRLLKLKVE